MAPTKLSDEQIDQEIRDTQWQRTGDELTLEVRLADFAAAMSFVNQVAEIAERMNHHPDISISWNRVSLRVTTHDSGGLTGLDFELARSVDRVVPRDN